VRGGIGEECIAGRLWWASSTANAKVAKDAKERKGKIRACRMLVVAEVS
jgi:hypothetical protein